MKLNRRESEQFRKQEILNRTKFVPKREVMKDVKIFCRICKASATVPEKLGTSLVKRTMRLRNSPVALKERIFI